MRGNATSESDHAGRDSELVWDRHDQNEWGRQLTRFDGDRGPRHERNVECIRRSHVDENLVWCGLRNPVRGLLHGVSGCLALGGAVMLGVEATSTEGRLSLFVFGLGLTALLLTSSLYHSVRWSPVAMRRMQRLDHSMIFILIAATFTPFAVLTLEGWPRLAALSSAWTLAVIGIVAVVRAAGGAPRSRVAAMIGLGWLSMLIAIPVARELGSDAVVLLAVGGGTYTLGGILFASGRPRLWPRVFSYHEVFHVFVVVAAVLHFVTVHHYLLPMA